MNQLGHFLKFPGSYRLLGKLAVSRTDARAAYAQQYLSVRPGQRVLDLGCGPADILSVLPDCEYVGAAAAMKEGLRMSREGDAA